MVLSDHVLWCAVMKVHVMLGAWFGNGMHLVALGCGPMGQSAQRAGAILHAVEGSPLRTHVAQPPGGLKKQVANGKRYSAVEGDGIWDPLRLW